MPITEIGARCLNRARESGRATRHASIPSLQARAADPDFIGVSIVAFAFIRLLPGDPILLLAGERGMTPERYQELQAVYGFDRPSGQQYFDYLTDILHGDLGTSIVTKRPVLDEFFALFPGDAGTVALRHHPRDRHRHPGRRHRGGQARLLASTSRSWASALVGYSMPIFWWGLLLIIFFSGMLQLDAGLGAHLADLFLPAGHRLHADRQPAVGPEGRLRVGRQPPDPAVDRAGTIPLAVIARQTRSAMLEVLGEDYVRTARAKGLAPRRVIGLHALRNALIPVVTTIGLQVGVLLAGAILTETIFSWPGIGKWMVDSVFQARLPVVQGGLLLIAGIVMIVNLARRRALRPDQSAHQKVIPAVTHIEAQHAETATRQIEPISAWAMRKAMLTEFWYYFRQNRGAVIGLVVFTIIVAVAVFAPLIAPHSPTVQNRERCSCRRS